MFTPSGVKASPAVPVGVQWGHSRLDDDPDADIPHYHLPPHSLPDSSLPLPAAAAAAGAGANGGGGVTASPRMVGSASGANPYAFDINSGVYVDVGDDGGNVNELPPVLDSSITPSNHVSSGDAAAGAGGVGDRAAGEDAGADQVPVARHGVQAQHPRKKVILAWIALLVAVFTWSVMGPSFVYLNRHGIKPILAVVWRNCCVMLFTLIPAAVQIYQSSPETRRGWFSKKPVEPSTEDTALAKVELTVARIAAVTAATAAATEAVESGDVTAQQVTVPTVTPVTDADVPLSAAGLAARVMPAYEALPAGHVYGDISAATDASSFTTLSNPFESKADSCHVRAIMLNASLDADLDKAAHNCTGLHSPLSRANSAFNVNINTSSDAGDATPVVNDVAGVSAPLAPLTGVAALASTAPAAPIELTGLTVFQWTEAATDRVATVTTATFAWMARRCVHYSAPALSFLMRCGDIATGTMDAAVARLVNPSGDHRAYNRRLRNRARGQNVAAGANGNGDGADVDGIAGAYVRSDDLVDYDENVNNSLGNINLDSDNANANNNSDVDVDGNVTGGGAVGVTTRASVHSFDEAAELLLEGILAKTVGFTGIRTALGLGPTRAGGKVDRYRLPEDADAAADPRDDDAETFNNRNNSANNGASNGAVDDSDIKTRGLSRSSSVRLAFDGTEMPRASPRAAAVASGQMGVDRGAVGTIDHMSPSSQYSDFNNNNGYANTEVQLDLGEDSYDSANKGVSALSEQNNNVQNGFSSNALAHQVTVGSDAVTVSSADSATGPVGVYGRGSAGLVRAKRASRRWLHRVLARVADELRRPLLMAVITGLLWGVNVSSWVTSLRYITTVVSSLLGSLCPVFLILFYLISKAPLSRGELTGTATAVVGVILCILSTFIVPTETRDTDNNPFLESGTWATILGAMLALNCSFTSAIEVLGTVKVRKHVPVFVWILYNLVFVTSLCAVFTLLFEGSSFSGISDTSLFGFLTEDFFPKVLFLGFLGGLVGLVGFKYSILYISPLVHTVVPLLDPMLTGIISYLLGYEDAPTWPVFVGGFVTITGIVVLVAGEEYRGRKRRWYIDALVARADAKLAVAVAEAHAAVRKQRAAIAAAAKAAAQSPAGAAGGGQSAWRQQQQQQMQMQMQKMRPKYQEALQVHTQGVPRFMDDVDGEVGISTIAL